MKKSYSKWIRRISIGIFFVALVLNIHLSFNPFAIMSEEVLAQTTETETSGESGNYGSGYLPEDKACTITEYHKCTITGSVTLFGNTYSCTVDFTIPYKADGTMTTCKYTGGPTSCTYVPCKRNGQ